ncbi:MAG: hypothetical protein HYS55_04075 [Candidatus Omnitrophica bacterium]|nr:hypothetical protein [Candidatus Omnitrophota bacterium]
MASFDRDPIEETQTKVVPVTQELLTREGEPGPASPTYKVSDTARFLVKKPYEEVEKSILDDLSGEEEGVVSEEDWFSWDEEEGSPILSEPIENK